MPTEEEKTLLVRLLRQLMHSADDEQLKVFFSDRLSSSTFKKLLSILAEERVNFLEINKKAIDGELEKINKIIKKGGSSELDKR